MEELFHIEKVLGFCDKVWYFFTVNLLFVISNFPILLFLLFIGAGQIRECLPLFLLCLVPMAPALSAVMYTMNRLIHGTEGKAVKDYKKGYCSDFLQKIGLGAGQMLVIIMCWTNIEFFTLQVRIFPFTIIFMILFAVAVLVTPNLYMLASRYEMKNIQIAKTAVTLLIAKPVSALGNIVALGVVLAAFDKSAGTKVHFMGRVYGLHVMFMNQSVLRKLESK